MHPVVRPGATNRALFTRMAPSSSPAPSSSALAQRAASLCLEFKANDIVLLDLDRWTGVLTNHRDGSDFNDHQYWAARTVQARTVRVVDHDARWWPRGQLRERLVWEARIFELHAPDDSPLRLAHRAECWIKTVPCAEWLRCRAAPPGCPCPRAGSTLARAAAAMTPCT